MASVFTESGLHPAYCYTLAGKEQKALQQLNVYKDFINKQFDKLLLSANETQAQRLIEKYAEIDNSFAMILSDTISGRMREEFAKLYYDWQLKQKGLLLAVNKEAENILSQHPSKYVRAQYETYKSAQRQLAENVGLQEFDKQILQMQVEMSQNNLQEAVNAYIDHYGNSGLEITDWQQIRDVLKPNEVAIEFAKGSISADTTTYFALLLRSGSQYPIVIPLFKEQELAQLTAGKTEQQIYNDTENNEKIAKLIIEPLSGYLKPSDRIYFSATGILHQIAFENMLYSNSRTLSDLATRHCKQSGFFQKRLLGRPTIGKD